MESGTEVSTTTAILVLVGFGILLLLWRYIVLIWVRLLMALAVTILLLLPAAVLNSQIRPLLPFQEAEPNAGLLKATVKPEAMAALVTASDSAGNQLMALGLAQFLLVGWAYTTICKGNERQEWLNTLTLVAALLLTICSLVAGMDAKFATIGAVAWHLEMMNPKLNSAAPTSPFDMVPFKMYWQGMMLLFAVALTLTCLPALWSQGRATVKPARSTADSSTAT